MLYNPFELLSVSSVKWCLWSSSHGDYDYYRDQHVNIVWIYIYILKAMVAYGFFTEVKRHTQCWTRRRNLERDKSAADNNKTALNRVGKVWESNTLHNNRLKRTKTGRKKTDNNSKFGSCNLENEYQWWCCCCCCWQWCKRIAFENDLCEIPDARWFLEMFIFF